METLRSPRWFVPTVVVLVLLRLAFISHDDLRAFPYDEAAYIGQAGAWYWKNHYNAWTYSRQPGYPLFLALSSTLGLPARLVIEALWIAVSLFLVRALRLAGLRPPLPLLLFTLLLFHPFATELFCRALADNLYAALLLVFLAAIAIAITRTDRAVIRKWGLLAGASGGILAITRQETVLVYVLILVAAALVAKAWALHKLPRSLAIRRLLLACALPLAISLATEHAVRIANYARIHAYVTYDWSLPGFKDLYRTMLSIPPADPQLRVPIPRDVRERAAAASPAYAKLLDAMGHDPRCKPYWRDGERTSGVTGEPGSYNLWLMREAAWIVNNDAFPDARATDAYYRTIARELRDAQDRGALPRRWAPLAFIPPQWGDLVRTMPASIATCFSSMSHIGFERDEPDPVSAADRWKFNAVAQRRAVVNAIRADKVGPGVAWFHRDTIAALDRIKRDIAAALPAFTIILGALAILGSIAAQFLRRSLPPAWYTLMAMFWSAFLLRLALVATLDATGVLATSRYMFPSAAILVPMGLLGLGAIIHLVRAQFTKRTSEQLA
jgi:hypothetical protein